MKQLLFLLVLMVLLQPLQAQQLEILSDSVVVDSTYFRLDELKIKTTSLHLKEVYKTIQTASEAFEKPYIGLPEERLQAKIDTLKARIKDNEVEGRVGFEHYEIYLAKNNLINFAVNTTSYHSPFEDWEYFLFDLNTGKKIESNLFVNVKKVLSLCRHQLKAMDSKQKITEKDLTRFIWNTTDTGTITGLDIIIPADEYRNSGYEQIPLHFDWTTIKNYLNPLYKKRLE